MSWIDEAVAQLNGEAKQLERMSDNAQQIVLRSPSMSDDRKKWFTKLSAQRQREAAELRKMVSELRNS